MKEANVAEYLKHRAEETHTNQPECIFLRQPEFSFYIPFSCTISTSNHVISNAIWNK